MISFKQGLQKFSKLAKYFENSALTQNRIEIVSHPAFTCQHLAYNFSGCSNLQSEAGVLMPCYFGSIEDILMGNAKDSNTLLYI